jgi:starch-binding outer membrane protein, SusD/RagB family
MNLYLYVFLTITIATFTSCEPTMDYANPSAASDENYYNTQTHLINAVNGAYNILQNGGCWARDMVFLLNARSDEYVYTTGAAAGEAVSANISQFNVAADNGFMTESWQDFYQLQYAANLAIEKLETNQDNAFDLTNATDSTLYHRLIGEATFLRGVSRFYLDFLWGDQIPDRNYVTTGGSDYKLGAATSGIIYKRMIQDFKTAAALLPVRSKIYTEDSNIGRATRGSALAFLAKAYMGRPILDGTASSGDAEWDSAKVVLKEIIDSGEYELINNYHDNFTDGDENNKESIFEVQFSDIDAGYWATTAQDTWRQIELTSPNSSESARWWNGQPSLAVYDEFERDANGNIIDPRAYQGLWIPDGAKFYGKSGSWIGYTKLFSGGTFDSWQGKWFACRKYGSDKYTSDPGNSGINDRLIRYADVLLMYAECCVETGDQSTALKYINMVRARANNQMTDATEADADMFYANGTGSLPTAENLISESPTLGKVVNDDGTVICSGTTINTVRRLLKHEYSVEEYWEGWRFFNLMRWYNNPNDPDASSMLNNLVNKNALQVYQTGLTGTATFSYSKNLRYPIPSSELETNSNLKGNSAN